MLCVITGGSLTPSAFASRSNDGGQTFTAEGELVRSTIVGGPVQRPCVSLAWDDVQHEFIGLAYTYDGLTPQDTVLVRSPDCASWTTEVVADASRWPTRYDWPSCASYSIVDGVHELWQVAAVADGFDLTRFWSAGSPSATVGLRHDPPLHVAGVADEPHVASFSGDLVVSGVTDGAFHARVVDRTSRRARDWLTVPPSRIEGTCDAVALAFTAPFLVATSSGGLAHACAVDDPDTVVAVVQTFDVSASP